MLIQTEPGFTWFYSCKKTPCVQCPTPRPSIDFSACEPLPQSISGVTLLHSKVLRLKGPKQECLCDFQKPPLLSFLSSLLPPLFCSVLSFDTTDKICFPIRVITNYWQHSPLVNYILELKLHLSLCLTPHHLCISPSPPPIRWKIINILYICDPLFSLYYPPCRALRFCKCYHTQFSFLFYTFLILYLYTFISYFIPFMLLQMVLISYFLWQSNIP